MLFQVFPRIPYFWSADHLYSVAAKIGPIRPQSLKFSPEELERITSKSAAVEPMEEGGQSLVTSLGRPGNNMNGDEEEEEDEEDEYGRRRRLETMDLLESPVSNFNPGGGSNWLQLAMASKMMGFPRPDQNLNQLSLDTGR